MAGFWNSAGAVCILGASLILKVTPAIVSGVVAALYIIGPSSAQANYSFPLLKTLPYIGSTVISLSWLHYFFFWYYFNSISYYFMRGYENVLWYKEVYVVSMLFLIILIHFSFKVQFSAFFTFINYMAKDFLYYSKYTIKMNRCNTGR